MNTLMRNKQFNHQQLDFLYWHAVSKTRISKFEDAQIIFKLIFDLDKNRINAYIGMIYCLIRLNDFESAFTELKNIKPLLNNTSQVELITRMYKRCKFELKSSKEKLEIEKNINDRQNHNKINENLEELTSKVLKNENKKKIEESDASQEDRLFKNLQLIDGMKPTNKDLQNMQESLTI